MNRTPEESSYDPTYRFVDFLADKKVAEEKEAAKTASPSVFNYLRETLGRKSVQEVAPSPCSEQRSESTDTRLTLGGLEDIKTRKITSNSPGIKQWHDVTQKTQQEVQTRFSKKVEQFIEDAGNYRIEAQESKDLVQLQRSQLSEKTRKTIFTAYQGIRALQKMQKLVFNEEHSSRLWSQEQQAQKAFDALTENASLLMARVKTGDKAFSLHRETQNLHKRIEELQSAFTGPHDEATMQSSESLTELSRLTAARSSESLTGLASSSKNTANRSLLRSPMILDGGVPELSASDLAAKGSSPDLATLPNGRESALTDHSTSLSPASFTGMRTPIKGISSENVAMYEELETGLKRTSEQLAQLFGN